MTSNLSEELEKALTAFQEKEIQQEQLDHESKVKVAGLEAIKNLSYEQVLDQHRQGDSWSSYYLGLMHLYGINTHKDTQIALDYFNEAKLRKHSMAQDVINQIKLMRYHINKQEELINKKYNQEEINEAQKQAEKSSIEAEKSSIEADISAQKTEELEKAEQESKKQLKEKKAKKQLKEKKAKKDAN